MKLRVLIINDLAGEFGGAEVASRRECSLLAANGHEVLYHGSSATFDFFSLFKRWFNPYQYWVTARLIRSFKPDIVHVHNLARMVSPSPAIAAAQAGVPVVMTFHDYHYVCPPGWAITDSNEICKGPSLRCALFGCKHRFKGWKAPFTFLSMLKSKLHRALLKRSIDFGICPNPMLRQMIERAVGLPTARMTVIPNFVDIKVEPLPWNENYQPLRLVYVGRLSDEKGPLELIEAIRPLAQTTLPRKFHLTMIGDGPLREKIQRKIEEYGLNDFVFLKGALPAAEIQNSFAECHAVVLPSQWLEVGPLTAIEAMAAGRAVIGPNRGGFVDIVTAETGFLYEAGDVAGLSHLLESLVLNPEILRARGLSAYTRAKAKFSAANHYEALARAYQNANREYSLLSADMP